MWTEFIWLTSPVQESFHDCMNAYQEALRFFVIKLVSGRRDEIYDWILRNPRCRKATRSCTCEEIVLDQKSLWHLSWLEWLSYGEYFTWANIRTGTAYCRGILSVHLKHEPVSTPRVCGEGNGELSNKLASPWVIRNELSWADNMMNWTRGTEYMFPRDQLWEELHVNIQILPQCIMGSRNVVLSLLAEVNLYSVSRNRKITCFIVHTHFNLTRTERCTQFWDTHVFKMTSLVFHIVSRDISVSIATGYGLEGPVSIPGSARFFSSPQHPDRLWSPSSLLTNGYRGLFPRG
jgi:hypothetical protein